MRRFTPVLIFILFYQYLCAQQPKAVVDPSVPFTKCETKPVSMLVPCMGLITPSPHERDMTQSLIHLGSENEGPDAELIRSIKAEKLKTKMETGGDGQESGAARAAALPVIGANFQGNTFSGSTPPDNSTAISNGGYIVTVTNSTIKFMNTAGTVFYDDSFSNFFSSSSLTSSLFDPVVLYDAGADRFFMVVLHGGSSATSKVLTCFSKTNNPNDGWYNYFFTGDPLGEGNWFDYPKIAVSTNEVYVTGNLFTDGGSFRTSVLYQLDKSDGYSGASINSQYWHDLPGSPASLLPVSYGQSPNYGPGIYMVSTTSAGGSSFNLYDLTDDLGGSPSINQYNISTSAYSVGSDVAQAGSSDLLSSGDCRALNGFYLNGLIHFVIHSDIGSGWNGIYYNRVDLSSMTNTSKTFGLVGTYDYCYPSVASFATTTSDKSVMIGFERSGSSIYPQARVVNCDNSMTFSSSVLVKSGEDYVDILLGEERWGDYTGISRKHNASVATVWTATGYANASHTYDTWIAEVTAVAVGIPDKSVGQQDMTVFPNPVRDMFTVQFVMQESAEGEINIHDETGRLVTCLFRDRIREGENQLSFNKKALSPGTYFVSVEVGDQVILQKKITVLD